MDSLEGRRVLITGAGSGIGRLVALRMARLGAELILWDLDAEALEAVTGEIRALPASAEPYICDLSDRRSIAEAAHLTLARHGSVEILVNNAGVVGGKPLLELTDEGIERTFAVNIQAHFRTVRAFLPSMIERGEGHVVTIASSGGLIGTARLTDYCATKFAAVGFDEAMRIEFRRMGYPVRTTVVCPYYVATGMFAGVKTRFSWLLPILDPEYVADRIVKAIRKRRRRLIMPRFVYVVYPIRLLPVGLFDWLVRLFAINRSMDEFSGRAKAEVSAPAE
jgi:all-trans-retinol dehydrogenase (NAD+)